ncbi:MAG: tetratricopeptide repeat protein, partial [Acidobacteriota bacterium]|nr:tetratricopeptide repeat protein [Acidobacteriota bacterium]
MSFLLALCAASCASADVIVLKNGNRIIGTNVTSENGRVTYLTSAGQLSIPQAIVARIEHDDSGERSGADVAPPVSAPQIEPAAGYEEIAHQTIHDGGVDYAYIARLESDARSGSAAATVKVAAAHYAAAQFFLSKAKTDTAIEQYREGLSFSPDNFGLLMNLSVLYLRQSQFTQALDPLQHAREVAPDSADVYKLMGWAYYGANKTGQAIDAWKQAAKLRPDPDVIEALRKAERDQALESSYREGETAHFDLKYSGSAAPELARGILNALESDYQDLESQLDYTPPEPIGVVLYTGQAFQDITRAPAWVGALNDGRIRIPVQGLTSVTPELARELKHELTHSFVGQKSHYRAPTWLQEGIAQWMEGSRSTSNAAYLIDAAQKGLVPQLGSLEGSWIGYSGDSAWVAYAWSLAVVESIIDRGGVSDMGRLIGAMAGAPSAQDAVQQTLNSDYDQLQQQTLA